MKIIKPSDREVAKEKEKKKESLSPCSYNNMDSFKSTQTRKVNAWISKYKINNYLDKEIKQNKWKIAPCNYDIDKAKNIVTKGSARGWK